MNGDLSSSPSQVSSLFKDGTIGTDINIVVVSLLLLEQDPVSWLVPSFRWEVSRLYWWLMGSSQLSHSSCLLLLPLCFHLQLGLTINHHADQSLNSFCQWQSGLVGKSGKRHDHAVLLTGLDICSWKNEPCDTLGKTKSNWRQSPWLKVMLCGNILDGFSCCQ